MQKPVIIQPPLNLTEPCPEPQGSDIVLQHMLKKDYAKAATAYTKYVLNVRDGFQMCNGKLKHIREFTENVKKNLGEQQ